MVSVRWFRHELPYVLRQIIQGSDGRVAARRCDINKGNLREALLSNVSPKDDAVLWPDPSQGAGGRRVDGRKSVQLRCSLNGRRGKPQSWRSGWGMRWS